MARDYAKLSPRFWTGHTGRQIRAAGCEAQVVALYLVSGPQANMIGLYYLPLPTLCHETGLSQHSAAKALRSLSELDFAFYDEGEEVVWVPEMARYQIADTLKAADNRIVAIEKEVGNYGKSRFYGAFLARYRNSFRLERVPPPGAARSPSEGPSKALGSQEQEQKHEQEEKQDSCAEPEADAPAPAPPVLALPCVGVGKKDYSVTAEQIATWTRAFSGVDVMAELRRMSAWLEANPQRRKTHGGMARAIVNWLSRAQDGGGRRRPSEPGLGVAPAENHIEGNVNVQALLRVGGGRA
jgi:hypothetical protein